MPLGKNMNQNRKIILSLLFGIICSGAALYVSFRNVPLTQLLDYVITINPWFTIASLLIGLSTYLLRALRWQMILGPVKKIGFWHAYHPLVISFMINCILPGRLGELARPTILFKRDKVEFSKTLATVALERIFDFLTLLIIFIVIMGALNVNSSLSLAFNGYQINKETLYAIRTKTIYASIILMGLIIMLILPTTRKALGRFISWLPSVLIFTTEHFRSRLSKRLSIKTHAILDNIALGFEVLKSPSKILACLLLSFGVWLVTFIAFYAIVLGSNGVDITFLQGAAVVIFICFFIMLPSVPGYWGIWEVGGIYGLMLFGVPKVEAAGLTLTYHFMQIIPLILVGLVSAWVTGVNIVQTGYHLEEASAEKAAE